MKGSLFSLLGSYFIHHPARQVEVTVSGDQLKIIRDHQSENYHAIEDIDVLINGNVITEEAYSTEITNNEEIVTIVLPMEPKAGDVIEVDTEIHRLGSKKVTLKVS